MSAERIALVHRTIKTCSLNTLHSFAEQIGLVHRTISTYPRSRVKSMENFSENAIEKIDKNENFLANEPEETLFLTSELDEKYGIRKTAKNERLKALYIKPIRQGRNFLINAEQLQLMDDLNAHLKTGGKTEDFVQERIADGRIVLPRIDEANEPEAGEEAESSALVTQEQTQALTQSPKQEVILVEPLPVESVSPHITDQELEAMDRQAQYIASRRYVATQELADYYTHTGSFTDPEVIERIRQRRAQTSSQWEQAHRNADPNALSQVLIQKAKQKATVGATSGQDSRPSSEPLGA